jgi:hypothetical protein
MTEFFYLQCSGESDKVAKLGSLAGDPEIIFQKGSEEARSATRVGWYSGRTRTPRPSPALAAAPAGPAWRIGDSRQPLGW